jgi:hypothetical protein
MSSQFHRLVWKEFHAQKGLWLALAIAVIGFEGLSWSVTRGNTTDFMVCAMVSAFVITLVFSMTSVALLFAGEEDHGTALWLRQLPLKTSTLIGAKLVSSIIGTLTLLIFAVLTLIVTAMLWGDAGSLLSGFNLFGNTRTEVLRGWAAAIVTLFSITVVYSLTLRKVFPTIGCWAGTAFVYVVVVWSTNVGPLSPAVLLITLAAGLLVIPLGRRWHIGRRRPAGRRMPSLPVSESSRRTLATTFPTFAQAFSLPFRLPGLIVLGEGTLLRRSTAIPTVFGRTVAVLAWREMRFAARFAALALLLGAVVITMRTTADAIVPWTSVLLFAMVIECGLRTFRHDQQKQHGLFWSHRGVSPLQVWVVRNAVWLSVLCFVSIAFVLGDQIPDMLRSTAGYNLQVRTELRSPSIVDLISHIHRPTLPTVAVTGDLLFQVNVSLAWLIGTFAVTQLASCWICRPILAAFAGLCGAVSFFVWLSFLVHIDVPLVISAWPIIGLCFVAMVMTRREWMDRRTSLRIRLKRTAMIVVPCLCMLPVQMIWRVAQVWDTSVAIAFESPVSLGYTHDNAVSQWAREWETFALSAVPARSLLSSSEIWRDGQLQGDQQQRALEALDTILAPEWEWAHMPPKWRVPWSDCLAPAVTTVLLTDAESLYRKQNFPGAIERTIQAIRLSRFLADESTRWLHWQQANRCEHRALRKLQRIVADDDMSEELLRSTNTKLAAVCTSLDEAVAPPVFAVIKNRYAVYLHLLMRRGYLWERFASASADGAGDSPVGMARWPTTLINSNFTERLRFLNVLSQVAKLSVNEFDLPHSESCIRWLATTNDADFDVHQDLYTTVEDRLRRSTITAEWATQTIVALQIYRRQHGQFPAHLLDLDKFEYGRSVPKHDAETHASFGYAALGFGAALPVVSDDTAGLSVVESSQPLLWSLGNVAPDKVRIHVDAAIHQITPADTSRIHFINGTTVDGAPGVNFSRSLENVLRRPKIFGKDAGGGFRIWDDTREITTGDPDKVSAGTIPGSEESGQTNRDDKNRIPPEPLPDRSEPR